MGGNNLLNLVSFHSRIFFLFTVPPSISGGCDHQSFYVLVKYGTFNFQTVVGKRMLTPVLAQQYGFVENGTHTSFAVPFTAPDVVFEVQSGYIFLHPE